MFVQRFWHFGGIKFFNTSHQYKNLTNLRINLGYNEVYIVVDFSENYMGKLPKEYKVFSLVLEQNKFFFAHCMLLLQWFQKTKNWMCIFWYSLGQLAPRCLCNLGACGFRFSINQDFCAKRWKNSLLKCCPHPYQNFRYRKI